MDELVKMDFTAFAERLKPASDEEVAEYEAKIEALEREQKEQMKISRYRLSGVPERYFTESLDTYAVTNDMQKTALEIARRFTNEFKLRKFKTLVLLGNSGTGKTHLACGIVREAGGKFRTAPEITEELRRAKSFGSNKTESEIVKQYSHIPLLVIDEIGRGFNATDEKYMLYQLVNARYNTKCPTVLISNFSKKDFLQYVGVAVVDRLLESAEIHELNGTSYRETLRRRMC